MNTGSGTITTQNLNGSTGVPTPGSFVGTLNPTLIEQNFCTVQVTGTWTGALSVQESLDNTNWFANGVITPISSATAAATIPSGTPNIYTCNITGAKQVRVTALAAVTGTAVVAIQTGSY